MCEKLCHVPEKEPRTALGALIRARRRQAGFQSQEALARRLGVGYRTVLRWESGENAPQEQHREVLAQLLGGTARDYVAPLSPTFEAAAREFLAASRRLAEVVQAMLGEDDAREAQ